MSSRKPKFARLALVVALAAGLTVALPQPAQAANCRNNAATGVSAESIPAEIPWNQALLGADRAWPHVNGSTVTVALLDTGVDASHPQLADRIEDGANYVTDDSLGLRGGGNEPGNFDCEGTGTSNAGIIAARTSDLSAVSGIAGNKARVLPLRVDTIRGDADGDVSDLRPDDFSPDDFAAALRFAAAQGAEVISVSMQYRGDYPAIENAINEVLGQDIVVIAAAGDAGNEWEFTYPAAYDGVVAVGAVDRGMVRDPQSSTGHWIDLMAPGSDLVALHRAQTWRANHEGSAAAAAHVAAAAALLRSQNSDWSAQEVTEQLFKTAAGAPGGRYSPQYGHGIVDPYRAVTNQVHPERDRIELPQMEHPVPHPDEVARGQFLSRTGAIAVAATTSMIMGGVALMVAVAAIKRANRRRWAAQRHRPKLKEVQDNPATARLFDNLWKDPG
ncbi:S8 family serine peptidase [Natronoglycomyces albus]|uniref:S8 family serine peptidase n=1 Tax=Natronoglycomyces albus TaxID=2811108 RepID=A0A895XHP6_9ACTN|nr:S8 family serine peptidase [Natronoglycomyces albus]QSB04864.1 S8 family serine peptidase [Natronoglycomyces albus]